ncbi:probable WRKY transcription factor 50 [Phalaenopsis equestris]|uniref:probable WRKY transcription factor 50 n=1 Tax=Phalaenopsis equestris TaxID=78828 RepID=UPI0009E204BB|nr:probable WRKY transcription factor 50 [Phalaenopsis equestris]
MAALLEFTDPTNLHSSFNLPDFCSRSSHNSPAAFTGWHSDLDVHSYVGFEDAQLFDDLCLNFTGESDAAAPAVLATKQNVGQRRSEGREMNAEEVKRRKIEAAEYRIGFRTKSDVEIMDDGFKWRKYGKKAVKSSPNPRNYYRCSSSGCGVKKRVERDRNDPSYVITIYEGTHNHKSPDESRHPYMSYEVPHSSSPWSSCAQIIPNLTPNFTWNTQFAPFSYT